MRSWHVLRHLGRFATVHLARFADDEGDAAHLAGLWAAMGGSLGEAYVEPRHRKRSWPLRALLRNQPATVAAFHGGGMENFARAMLARPQVEAGRFLDPHGACSRWRASASSWTSSISISAKYAGYAADGRGLRKLALMRDPPAVAGRTDQRQARRAVRRRLCRSGARASVGRLVDQVGARDRAPPAARTTTPWTSPLTSPAPSTRQPYSCATSSSPGAISAAWPLRYAVTVQPTSP